MVRDDVRGNWKMNRILIAKQWSFIIDNYLWNISCVWELELEQKMSENVTKLLMNRLENLERKIPPQVSLKLQSNSRQICEQ